jgi:hypothetical protein
LVGVSRDQILNVVFDVSHDGFVGSMHLGDVLAGHDLTVRKDAQGHICPLQT